MIEVCTLKGGELTVSEADVAAFTLKGCAVAETAEQRGAREGAVRAHLNAIHRKAGMAGRGQLVSLLVEDLMRAPLVPEATEQPRVWMQRPKSV